jgi:lipopolysaccharide heptosyltransferase I
LKALVVRLSSVGDVVHTLPALVALQRAGWEVGWLVESPGATLLDRHPLVSRLARAPRASAFHLGAAAQSWKAIRGQGFDVALDFQGLWKSALWARFSDAPRVIGYASAWRREPASSFLVGEQIALPADAVHVIDKNLALLRALSIDALGLREFPLPPTTAERTTRIDGLLKEMELGPFALLNPGGSWESKLWPPESYGALARALQERGLAPLVTWGPGEERLAERVVGASQGAARRCFPTSLLDFVELARRARLVVSADTGPLHLACAVRTPVVALFGPTDPARNGPFAAEDVVVRRLPLCAPCYRPRCATHEGVMKAIPTDEVVRAVDRRLGSVSGGAGRV